MEVSAGSAEREMDKITQSLEYKLNELQETWTGVAQDLLDDSLLKGVVDVLTWVSERVGNLTEHLGLLGTVGIAGTIACLAKLKSSVGRPKMTGFTMIAPTYALVVTKYRRKAFYGEKRREIGEILRTLCEWKKVRIVEAEVCPDHVHMRLEIPPKVAVFYGILTLCMYCHGAIHGTRWPDMPDWMDQAELEQAAVEHLADYYAGYWYLWERG